MIQHLSDLRTDRRYFDPAGEAVRLHFHAREDGFVLLAVFSDQEGWVWSAGEQRVRAGANVLVWHGRDAAGGPLPAGEYTLALYGFNTHHGPSGDLPLRVQVALVRRPRPAAKDGVAGARRSPERRGLLGLFRRAG